MSASKDELLAKLRAKVTEAWEAAKERIIAKGVLLPPWPENCKMLGYRWGTRWPLAYGLEPEPYVGRNYETPEEAAVRSVADMEELVYRELEAAGSMAFYVRKPPTVWLSKPDEYGHFLCFGFRGCASPVAAASSILWPGGTEGH